MIAANLEPRAWAGLDNLSHDNCCWVRLARHAMVGAA